MLLNLFSNEVAKKSKEHAASVFPEESVGLVVQNDYIPVNNIHKDPENNFKVHGRVLGKYKDQIQAVIHSHNITDIDGKPKHDPFPSYDDMVTQIKWDIPFGIQLINEAGPGNILWWGYEEKDIPPLEGRPYIHGVYDCFSLLRDYFRINLNRDIKDFPRHDEWWLRDDCPNNLYMDNAKKDFYQVDLKDMKANDVILLCIRSKVPNHSMIYMGGDVGIHHLTLCASRKESVSRYIDPQKTLFHSVWRLK